MGADFELKGFQEIAGRVEGVRSTKRRRIFLAGMLLACAIVIGGFLVYSAVDIWVKLTPTGRILSLAATLAAVAAGAYLIAVRPWRRMGDLTKTANEVEAKYPEIENNLSTTIEYGGNPELTKGTSSPALVEALIQQTATRTADLDFKKTVNWRRVGRTAAAAFLLGLIVFAYYSWSPRLASLTWQRFMNPTAELPAPTLTVIEDLSPGTSQIPLETSQKIAVSLGGRVPDVARLKYKIGEGDWETVWMESAGEGRFNYTLRRLLEDVNYQVSAGDAESVEHVLEVYREPQVDELQVTLRFPEYTGKQPEKLREGLGDVAALAGTQVMLQAKSNVPLSSAKVRFSSDLREVPAVIDDRGFAANFTIAKDDRYALAIADRKGRPNKTPPQYRITALADKPPVVAIRKPAPDISIHRNQEIEVEIDATDDYGVREFGLYNSMGAEVEKKLVRRYDPCLNKASSVMKWNLALQGLRGGEVIAYWAYAIDNDARTGPKEARSSIHFLTVYDEEEYLRPKTPKQKQPPMPDAIKQLDKLIEAQKRLLRDTFNAARTREGAKGEITEIEKKSLAQLKDKQSGLKDKLEGIVAEVKAQLEGFKKDEGVPEGHHGEGGEKGPKDTGMGEKELKHLEEAGDRMGKARDRLADNDSNSAVPPETEALRHLSDCRRLLLSDKDGSPTMRKAMNQQAKNRRKKEQEQEQEQQKQVEEELAQLPPMMDKQKEIERDLEELIRKQARAQQQGQPPPEEEKQEQRKLRRKVEEDLTAQADEAQKRAEARQQMQQENTNVPQDAAQKAEESKKKFDEAKKHLQQGEPEKAQTAANEAMKKRMESDRRLEQAMNNQFEQALRNALQDSKRLSDEQRDQADQTQRAQEQAQAAQQNPQNPQGNPQNQQNPQNAENPQGNPQGEGDPKAALQKAMAAGARKQQETAEDLKNLKERLDKLAEQAAAAKSPSAEDVKNAADQAQAERDAGRAMEKAREALENAKPEDAARAQNHASEGMSRIERRMAEALSKHMAGGNKEIAELLEKARELSARQAAAEQEVREGKDPAEAGKAQEKNARDAKSLAAQAKEAASLRKNARGETAAEHFDKAAEKMAESNRNLEGRNQKDQAAESSAKATQEAKRGTEEIARALNEGLLSQANETANQAKEARENEEKTATSLKDVGKEDPKKKLAEARDTQGKAAAATRRLEGALKDLAQQAEAAKSENDKQSRDLVDRMGREALPEKTAGLEKDVAEAHRSPKEGARQAPQMAERGEKIAGELSKIENDLKAMISDLKGQEMDRMRAAEEKARQAAEQAEQVGKDTAEQPQDKNEGEKRKKEQATRQTAEDLERNVEGLVSRLRRLLPDSREQKEAQEALDQVRQANQQLPKGPQSASGNFNQASKNLQKVGQGLVGRIERELKSREIREPADETAPKEYRALIEKYYRALSEDTER